MTGDCDAVDEENLIAFMQSEELEPEEIIAVVKMYMDKGVV